MGLVFTGYGISELSRETPEIRVEPTPVDVKPAPVNLTQNKSIDKSTEIHRKNHYRYDYTNFQANHVNDLEYKVRNNNLVVEDVDFCGELYGSSMQVAIWDGNTVCFREYSGQKLREGQIIRFKANDTVIVHTITGDYSEQRGYVKTRGYTRFNTQKIELSQITHVAVGNLYT